MILLITFAAHSKAACDTSNGDASLSLAVIQGIDLGHFTRPDSGQGSATVTIDTAGNQTLPFQLDVKSNDPASHHAAKLQVTGQPGCDFQITVSNVGSGLSNIILAGGSSYTLDSSISPAKGTLDGSGRFDFTVGTSILIPDSGGSGAISNSFDVTVAYD